MARRKKDGRRSKGIQAKKGMLYLVISKSVIRGGQKISEKKRIATGLTDTPENLVLAQELRQRLISTDKNRPLVDRDITVTDYTNQYLSKIQRVLADTTFNGYEYCCRRICKFFDTVRVRDVSQANVEQFYDELFTKSHLQLRTVQDTRAMLNRILEQALIDGLITTNPVEKATMNKTLVQQFTRSSTDDSDTFFSFQEAQAFITATEKHPLYELFYFTLFFGLRREEVLGLRWSSVDFVKKEFKVNHTVTKGTKINHLNTTKTTASERTYPLLDEQLRMLEHLKTEEARYREVFGASYHENSYVFKHEDGSLYYPDYPSKAFRKIIKAHPELPQKITFHKLRTSCVSILIHKGYDVKRIQKWVGHADIDTTLKIYAKVKDKEGKQEILQGMQDIIQPKKYED